MPVKHQQDSYRNRNGVRFECWADVCDTLAGDLRTQAQAMTREIRASGLKAFFEKHDGGAYYRVFREVQPKSATGEGVATNRSDARERLPKQDASKHHDRIPQGVGRRPKRRSGSTGRKPRVSRRLPTLDFQGTSEGHPAPAVRSTTGADLDRMFASPVALAFTPEQWARSPMSSGPIVQREPYTRWQFDREAWQERCEEASDRAGYGESKGWKGAI